MGSALKQLKKGKVQPSPVNLKFLEQLAYDRGFNEGAAEQRKLDIESTTTLLAELETIPGIGEKLAWKVREHVIKQYGAQS